MINIKILLMFAFLFIFFKPAFSYEYEQEKIILKKDDSGIIRKIEKQNYSVHIKQYNKDYPVVLYVILKERPSNEEVKNMLYKELKLISKKEGASSNVIASAWISDSASEMITKIELSEKSGAFVWISKEKRILSFNDYVKYLKKHKKNKKQPA